MPDMRLKRERFSAHRSELSGTAFLFHYADNGEDSRYYNYYLCQQYKAAEWRLIWIL